MSCSCDSSAGADCGLGAVKSFTRPRWREFWRTSFRRLALNPGPIFAMLAIDVHGASSELHPVYGGGRRRKTNSPKWAPRPWKAASRRISSTAMLAGWANSATGVTRREECRGVVPSGVHRAGAARRKHKGDRARYSRRVDLTIRRPLRGYMRDRRERGMKVLNYHWRIGVGHRKLRPEFPS